MVRTILLVLALAVLIAIGLFWTGVLYWPGGNQPVQANPVKVEMKESTVNVVRPAIRVQNGAEPVPAN